ncbi:MAG: class I SAM-dependent methyltransferase [Myxococcales bacterium]
MPDTTGKDTRRYYDELSRSYDRTRQGRYHRMIDELELSVLEPYARHARTLELGCGTGLVLERVAAIAREAVGVDFSQEMARRAMARGLQVHIGHLCELPFGDDEFDVTYSFKVLAHVPDVGRALREAVRVTRPGGFILVDLYNPWSLRYAAKVLGGPRPIGDGRTEADVYTRWDSPIAMRRLVPPGANLVEVRGIRVLTPFAALLKTRWLAPPMVRAEHWASRSPLRFFGGFLIAVLRKRG